MRCFCSVRNSFNRCVVVGLKEVALFLIFLFAFTVFLFPLWYSGAINADISDTYLKNFITWLPVIIVVVISVIPLYQAIGENK